MKSMTSNLDLPQFKNDPEQFFLRKNLLETVINTMEVGVISCNSEGILTLFNEAARNWHGLPAKEIPQEEWAQYYNLYEPDGSTIFKTEDIPLVELLTKGSISKSEMYIKPSTGKPKFISVNGTRLFDEDKNLVGAVVSLHNITERKAAEEKLRISEETFRGSFENAAIGMSISDSSAKFTAVNESLCKMLGHSESELLKISFLEITHPDDIESDKTAMKELIAGGKNSLQKEKRFLHKNGKVIHTMLAVSVVRTDDGHPLDFIAQITDISSLKNAEKELQQTLNQLEDLLKASTRVSIIGLNEQAMISSFNTGAENLLGYSKEDMIGKKIFDTIHFQEEVEQRAEELSQTFARNVQPREVFTLLADKGIPDTREWNYRCKNGKKLPVQLTITPVFRNESLAGYLCVGTDISDLKYAENELTSVLEIATDQNQRLKNFAHIVSHNLRSHSGNFEMLLDIFRDEYPDLKENEIVEMLFQASGNLKETIAHLNEVALINTSISENIQPLNLKESVDQALGSINAIIQKTGLQIYNNIPPEYKVLALPAYLESIILNFSTNAIKYRSPERTAKLGFSADITDEYICLSIEDNGIGIDLGKNGHKLFGMYKTFHSHEDARGIGLFITKNQIEALGGKVEVQSEVGKGSIFTIFFKYEKN